MLKIQMMPYFAKRLTSLKVLPLRTRNLSSFQKARFETESVAEDSDVHKIKTSFVDPIDLFSQWYNEHMAVNVNVTSAKAFSLATISKTGKVSCRSLILRRLDKDGFVMMTDGRSSKSKELAENPVASMVFLWLGKTTSNDNQTRQVRIEGVVNKLSTDNMQELYDIEPLFCKIRAQICEQGQPVEWNRLKRDHDLLLNKVINENIPLPKPDHVVAYKLVPNVMEFYETTGMKIADRLLFVKDDAFWRSKRLAA
ncbi:pyridoxine/pyridoxamine 5'-phosphate oxidase isoform X2 [Daktulosphaira vitifoliae]|uniref:pyridoxine/pyridoxamine 5'-phosphate oxidase isoform X2 n=2 Tax=Daktulosphaira vitifoliae TaxID=58002 RepID=UPI0021A9A257|nr:pyridoxine/pyridoxamine 5'-phosphate oxidase isoform X2 [Daktulosphaira vitifoliae]